MTDTRLASIEDIRAALHATIPYPSTWPGGDHSKWSQHYAERILQRLPAAPAEAGLREALAPLVRIAKACRDLNRSQADGIATAGGGLSWAELDAALAAQEGAE